MLANKVPNSSDTLSTAVYVVGTASNESELTKTSSAVSSVTGASENIQLLANKVPNSSDTQSTPVYVVGTASNESELTSTSCAEFSQKGE